MRRIYLGDQQISGTSNAIFITGSPRSGTTLVAKYVASFENIEYHYEPPLLYLITSMVAAETIDTNIAVDILRLYLYEDLLVESVHGRKVNMRSDDDSSIFNSMTWKELNRRWRTVTSRQKAIEEISQKGLRLAVKMPSIMNAINFLTEGFINCAIIIVLRDGQSVIPSILRKKWMRDDSLEREYWPYKINKTNRKKIPYFIEEKEEEKWDSMNEATRACFVWRKEAETILKVFQNRSRYPNVLFIRYEDILNNPFKAVSDLAGILGHSFTDMTDILIKNTKMPTSMTRRLESESIFKSVDDEELERFKSVNMKLGYK